MQTTNDAVRKLLDLLDEQGTDLATLLRAQRSIEESNRMAEIERMRREGSDGKKWLSMIATFLGSVVVVAMWAQAVRSDTDNLTTKVEDIKSQAQDAIKAAHDNEKAIVRLEAKLEAQSKELETIKAQTAAILQAVTQDNKRR